MVAHQRNQSLVVKQSHQKAGLNLLQRTEICFSR